MQHRLMKYLDEVARSGSIRSAAQKLHVAASAIQRQIKLFEEEIGTPVFSRSHKGLELTATGELVLGHIRETMRNEERMMSEIKALNGVIRQNLTIVCEENLASTLLFSAIVDFQQNHKSTKINVLTAQNEDVQNVLLDGKADLALAYDIEKQPRFAIDKEVKCPLGLFLRKGHSLEKRLQGKTKINLAEIIGEALVLPEKGTKLKSLIETLGPPLVTAVPIVETSSMPLIVQLVATGNYVSILSRTELPEGFDNEFLFIPVITHPAYRILTLFHQTNRALKPVEQQFQHVLMEQMKERLSRRNQSFTGEEEKRAD